MYNDQNVYYFFHNVVCMFWYCDCKGGKNYFKKRSFRCKSSLQSWNHQGKIFHILTRKFSGPKLYLSTETLYLWMWCQWQHCLQKWLDDGVKSYPFSPRNWRYNLWNSCLQLEGYNLCPWSLHWATNLCLWNWMVKNVGGAFFILKPDNHWLFHREGQFCDICLTSNGCKHGSCKKPFECNCDQGWSGRMCSKRKKFELT